MGAPSEPRWSSCPRKPGLPVRTICLHLRYRHAHSSPFLRLPDGYQTPTRFVGLPRIPTPTGLGHSLCRDSDVSRRRTKAGRGFCPPSQGCFSVRPDWTPLHLAAYKGDWADVVVLAQSGAEVNAVDDAGRTPLHCAAGFASQTRRPVMSAPMVQILIETGGNVKAMDTWGLTPLHYADTRATATILLAAGADVNARTNDKRTPLHCAAAFGTKKRAVVAALIKAGAVVDARDDGGRTPLHSAAASRRPNAPEHSTDVLTSLIDAGADVNARARDGSRPLHCAAGASKPSPQIVATLIEAGADVSARTADARTPLHFAAAAYDFSRETVNVLVWAGADVNARASDGRTPLHYAVAHTRWVPRYPNTWTPAMAAWAVTTLVEAGADVNARTQDGRTPLDVTATSGRPSQEARMVLIDAGAARGARDSDS